MICPESGKQMGKKEEMEMAAGHRQGTAVDYKREHTQAHTHTRGGVERAQPAETPAEGPWVCSATFLSLTFLI